MREAFGGTFMIQILLVFIIIYVGFIGIAINYGKSFRIKNFVIDYLEENEIGNLSNASVMTKMETDINAMLKKYGYENSTICGSYVNSSELKCIDGVVIQLNGDIDKNGVKHVYYTVNTFIGYDLGFLSSLLSLTRDKNKDAIPPGYFRISGETKVIVTS